jgi:hypothetical protein
MDGTLLFREEQTGSIYEPNLGENRRLAHVVGHHPGSDTTIAYIAGVLDGEGCIQIEKPKRKHNREKSQTYKLQVRIANTDLRLIEYINGIFPAYIYNGSEKRKGRRRQFVWHANGKKAAQVLRQLLPYLICKREQAEVAISFQETFNKYYGVHGLPKEVLDAREYAYLECRKYKKREFAAL